jgi:hypothetical protein
MINARGGVNGCKVNFISFDDDFSPTKKPSRLALSGETKVYRDKGDSWQPVYRHICGSCGSPIMSKIATRLVFVRAGTLDDMSMLEPAMEVYTDHAADWVIPIAGARRFGRPSAGHIENIWGAK